CRSIKQWEEFLDNYLRRVLSVPNPSQQIAFVSHAVLGGDTPILLVFEVLQIHLVLAGLAVEQLAPNLHGTLTLIEIEPVLDLVASARRLCVTEPVAAGMMS